MKAHDWHVFMFQGVVNIPNEFPKLKEGVVITLCMLEMEMLIAFFDVMAHLVLHFTLFYLYLKCYLIGYVGTY